LYGETFLIKILTDTSKFATVKVREGELVLIFPELSKPERRNKVASKLVAKIMASYFQPKVHRRILELNTSFFQKKITKVTLKNNTSNWGSCSVRSNINISTRLLFAPEYVIDYVFIHELTHLVHMDHSERFWNHVASIMPDYEKAEKWLKINGGKCLF
jgi:predicted metal-dependent hydrolase